MSRIETRRAALAGSLLLVSACTGELEQAVPQREPLVDPSGRVEEIPDTEYDVPPLHAQELTGERQAAAERHTARVLHVGQRIVRRWGRDIPELALARLDAGELAAHFEDARVAAGNGRGVLA